VPLSVMMELGTPKQKMMSWMKLTAWLEPIFTRGFASIHLVNLSTATSRWVKPPGAFLKGPRRSRSHTANGYIMGIVWSSWVGAWICLMKYCHPLQDLTICAASPTAVDQLKPCQKAFPTMLLDEA
jgi:hypothetical protein